MQGCSGRDSEWLVSSIYNNGYRVRNCNVNGKGIYCSPNIETAVCILLYLLMMMEKSIK